MVDSMRYLFGWSCSVYCSQHHGFCVARGQDPLKLQHVVYAFIWRWQFVRCTRKIYQYEFKYISRLTVKIVLFTKISLRLSLFLIPTWVLQIMDRNIVYYHVYFDSFHRAAVALAKYERDLIHHTVNAKVYIYNVKFHEWGFSDPHPKPAFSHQVTWASDLLWNQTKEWLCSCYKPIKVIQYHSHAYNIIALNSIVSSAPLDNWRQI